LSADVIDQRAVENQPVAALEVFAGSTNRPRTPERAGPV
jgi:hypothetical protein